MSKDTDINTENIKINYEQNNNNKLIHFKTNNQYTPLVSSEKHGYVRTISVNRDKNGLNEL